MELEPPVDDGCLIPELLLMVWTHFSIFPPWTTGGDVFLLVWVALKDMGVEDDNPLTVWQLVPFVLHVEELAVTDAVTPTLQVVVVPEVGQGL